MHNDMKTSEIKKLTVSEIEERLVAEKAALTRLKINHSISPLDNPTEITKTRKTIAKLSTELSLRSNQE